MNKHLTIREVAWIIFGVAVCIFLTLLEPWGAWASNSSAGILLNFATVGLVVAGVLFYASLKIAPERHRTAVTVCGLTTFAVGWGFVIGSTLAVRLLAQWRPSLVVFVNFGMSSIIYGVVTVMLAVFMTPSSDKRVNIN